MPPRKATAKKTTAPKKVAASKAAAPRRRTTGKGATAVTSTVHNAKRTNIPTEELRDFVADDERSPVPVTYERPLLYPRDPSADPQLVWKGKDAQDAEPLTIPSLPLYIQEKIEPRALIEDLRRESARRADYEEVSLFEQFDGLEGFDKVDFYKHAANWSNRMIRGDSLLVMNSLAEKENLRGQVQMIYLDPPYGIKFNSNWQVSTRKRDVKDGTDASRQPEQVLAFRDTWKWGIHSYLSYLRDRLTVARELLTDSGSIFVQIGDENVHHVREVMDEVFGVENSVSQIIIRKTTAMASALLGGTADYILWFAKDASKVKYRPIYAYRSEAAEARYDQIMLADGTCRAATLEEKSSMDRLPEGARLYQLGDLTNQRPIGEGDVKAFTFEGRSYTPAVGKFKTDMRGLEALALAGRIQPTSGGTLRYVRFADDFGLGLVTNLWNDISGAVQSRTDPKIYVVQSSTALVTRCMIMSTDPGDLVLDPTCGSGTTAYVCEQWGRRWITVDTSRVALALARTRLMAGRYPYYLLADSADGAATEAEITGIRSMRTEFTEDVRQGFVCKRVPHITLRSIAQNEKIVPGLSRVEIDRIIAQSAEQETLVDQPYEDSKKVRVTGRFTVESLSPHRTLDRRDPESLAGQTFAGGSYTDTIIENLRKSGVQNTFKGERLTFDTLEPYAGDGILHAHGTTTDVSGESRTVAVAIGPEHGTVSPDSIKDAAREALKGTGFDMLIVCAFAFDAYAMEVTKEFAPSMGGFATVSDERKMGRLAVLLAHMNPDLAMSDELLKRTGSGNLFTVFGEPDISIKEEDGKVTVEIFGLDVYDPTTGQVRPSSVDDIACWFIDTDYDEEQFFVRHAYFTGADKPFEKLQRSLNTDIDPDAWQSLYSNKSRPFDKPSTGKIAVKVINHYGDEVLQVYRVATPS